MSHWHLHPGVRTGDQLTLSERAADKMRNSMGSWAFVGGFIAIMAVWAIVNSVFYLGGAGGAHGFDPYPYILLNLMLSMVAGLQGAILLIAAKRSDQVSSELAVHTYRNTEDQRKILENQDTVLATLDTLTKAIHDHIVASNGS